MLPLMAAQLTSLRFFAPIQPSSALYGDDIRCHYVISRVQTRVRHSKSQCSAQAPAQETQVHPLSVWLESREVPVKRLGSQPKIVKGKLCLVATRPTAKGQTLAAIPQKAWLTQQTVAESPIGIFLEELDGWLQICLFLLYERSKQKSAWGPYLDCLPRHVDLPLFWSEQELQELQGTQLLSSVEGYRCISTRQLATVPQADASVPSRTAFTDPLWRRPCLSVIFESARCFGA